LGKRPPPTIQFLLRTADGAGGAAELFGRRTISASRNALASSGFPSRADGLAIASSRALVRLPRRRCHRRRDGRALTGDRAGRARDALALQPVERVGAGRAVARFIASIRSIFGRGASRLADRRRPKQRERNAVQVERRNAARVERPYNLYG
jgi:hypothetical protein